MMNLLAQAAPVTSAAAGLAVPANVRDVFWGGVIVLLGLAFAIARAKLRAMLASTIEGVEQLELDDPAAAAKAKARIKSTAMRNGVQDALDREVARKTGRIEPKEGK